MIIDKKGNIELSRGTMSNGVEWYRVVALETESFAADMLYEGSDKAKAQKAFDAAAQEAK